MGFFNFYGLAAIVIILIPNILYAIFNNSGVATVYEKKIIIIFEQIGRFGCMLFMIFKFRILFSVFGLKMRLIYTLLLSAYCYFYIYLVGQCLQNANVLLKQFGFLQRRLHYLLFAAL